MIKKEALAVYYAIKSFKSGGMDKDLLYAYAKARIELRKVALDFDLLREEVQGADNAEGAVMEWLNEPVDIKPVFSLESAVEFCQHNDANGDVQDILMEYMV